MDITTTDIRPGNLSALDPDPFEGNKNLDPEPFLIKIFVVVVMIILHSLNTMLNPDLSYLRI